MVVYPHNWIFSLDLHFQVLPPNNAFPFSDKAIWILSINTRKYVGCSQESSLGGFSVHYCSFSDNGHTIHSCFPRRSYLPRWFETTNLSMFVQRRKVLYCFRGKPPDHVVHLTSFGRLEIDLSLWNFHIHSVAHSTTMVSFVYCTYTTPSSPPFPTSQLHPTQPLQAGLQHPAPFTPFTCRRTMEVDVISYSSCISACDKGAQWQSALLLLKLMPVRALQVAGLWEPHRYMGWWSMTAADGMLDCFLKKPTLW